MNLILMRRNCTSSSIVAPRSPLLHQSAATFVCPNRSRYIFSCVNTSQKGNRPYRLARVNDFSPSEKKKFKLEPSKFRTTTTSLLSRRSISLSNEEPLLNAFTYINENSSTPTAVIPKPEALSPSSAACFKRCPQSYLFQYLFKIREPKNEALAKGTMCHSALENVFDLEPKDRTLENLQNLFRASWSDNRLTDEYRHLFDHDDDNDNCHELQKDDTGEHKEKESPKRNLEEERKWGVEGLRLLKNYFDLEDPRLVTRPNPIEREFWVNAKLTVDPSQGVTGYAGESDSGSVHRDDVNEEHSHVDTSSNDADSVDCGDTFLVRGIVDRLDYVAVPPSPRSKRTDQDGAGVVRIIDYKTGKAPNFKYSPAMNEKIAMESTWQLKIYALLLREMAASSNTKSGLLQNLTGEELRLLRLMYLTSSEPNGIAKYLDMDLGETQEERDKALQEVHAELAGIWKNILKLVDTQDPTKFVHCDNKWCFCHTARAKFVPGSVFMKS